MNERLVDGYTYALGRWLIRANALVSLPLLVFAVVESGVFVAAIWDHDVLRAASCALLAAGAAMNAPVALRQVRVVRFAGMLLAVAALALLVVRHARLLPG